MTTSALPLAELEEIAETCLPLSPSLQGAQIMVTGCSGFFGTWLVAALLHLARHHGVELTVVAVARRPEALLGRLPESSPGARLVLVTADVTQWSASASALAAVSPTHLIHAATPASASLNAEAPIRMATIAAEGTRQVLSWAASRGVARSLLTSSGAIYGRQPAELPAMPESYAGAPDPLDSSQAYAEGKRLAENYAAAFSASGQLPVTVARCFAFAGPLLPLDAHFAFGNFVRDAVAGGPIVVQGDGTPLRSYLYATDLVVWLLHLLVRGRAGRAYNVGSSRAVSIRDLARQIAELGGCDYRVLREPVEGVAPARYVPDTTLAQRELGLQERVLLRESITRTLSWARRASP